MLFLSLKQILLLIYLNISIKNFCSDSFGLILNVSTKVFKHSLKYIIYLISLFSFKSLGLLFKAKIISIFNIILNSSSVIILSLYNFETMEVMSLNKLFNFLINKNFSEESISLLKIEISSI